MASRNYVRPTTAESAARRVEVVRLHKLGVSSRKTAKEVGVSQQAVCKILKKWRAQGCPDLTASANDGYQRSSRQIDAVTRAEQPDRERRSAPPTTALSPSISTLTHEEYQAHVVDQTEADIEAARASKSFSAISGLRKIQTGAFDRLVEIRGSSNPFDELTTDELVALLADSLSDMPAGITDQIVKPPKLAAVDPSPDREVG